MLTCHAVASRLASRGSRHDHALALALAAPKAPAGTSDSTPTARQRPEHRLVPFARALLAQRGIDALVLEAVVRHLVGLAVVHPGVVQGVVLRETSSTPRARRGAAISTMRSMMAWRSGPFGHVLHALEQAVELGVLVVGGVLAASLRPCPAGRAAGTGSSPDRDSPRSSPGNTAARCPCASCPGSGCSRWRGSPAARRSSRTAWRTSRGAPWRPARSPVVSRLTSSGWPVFASRPSG